MTTEYTPNFRFNLPDFRMGPWHDLVNTNTVRIDQLLLAIYQGIDTSPWMNNTAYTPGQTAIDVVDNSFWVCSVAHTSAPAPTTFAQDRTAHPTYWVRSVVGLNPRGQWVNNRLYFVNDLVSDATQGIIAVCITQHTSNTAGTIRNDAAFWTFLVDMTGGLGNQAIYVSYNNATSGLPATTVQAAIDALDAINENQQIGINNVTTRMNVNEALDATQDSRLTALEALPAGVPEAPNDGQTYGRKSLGWQAISGVFTDAPLDGIAYGRVNAAWQQVVKRAGDTMTGMLQVSHGSLASEIIGLSTLADTATANFGYASILGNVNAGAYAITGFRAKVRASIAGMGSFQHTGDATYMITGVYGWVPLGGHGATATAGMFDRPDGLGNTNGPNNSYSVVFCGGVNGNLGKAIAIFDWVNLSYTLTMDGDGSINCAYTFPAADSSVKLITSAFLTSSALRFDRAQTLTDTQKSQARANLGVTAKNYIVNGGLSVSQEWQDTAGTASQYYPADMFNVIHSLTGGAVSIQRFANSPPPALTRSTHRVRVLVSTILASPGANNYLMVQTRIEGLRFHDLMFGTAAAKPITIQFTTRAPAGTYGISIQNGAGNRSYSTTYVISAGEANADVVKSVTIPGDTSGTWLGDTGVGAIVYWTLMAGSNFQTGSPNTWVTTSTMTTSAQFNLMGTVNNAFWISDVGLYEGTVPPPFELPDVAGELAKCQRYYQFVHAACDAVASGAGITSAHGVSYPTTMRATPTLTFIASSGPSNCSVAQAFPDSNGFCYQLTSTAAGRFYAYGRYACNARL